MIKPASRRGPVFLAALSAVILLATLMRVEAAAQAVPDADPVSQTVASAGGALEGELEILHQDYQHTGRYLYFLKTAAGTRVPLHFAKHPPTNLLTGARIRARGAVDQNGALTLASGGTESLTALATTATTSSTAPLPNTFGAQKTLVILVNFSDNTSQPWTPAQVRSAIFTTNSNFIFENSYGQTWLTGDVVGWYTLPVSSTTCDLTSIANYAQSAATAAGTNLAAYTRYVYAFPWNSVCGWAGTSQIGGSPSQSWINDSILDVHVVDHELGHAMGLWHSHLLDCGAGATVGSGCAVDEYGDLLDTMGVPQTASPHYNAFQKERLGWLNAGTSPTITTVQTSGTYTINAYELAGSGPNALKILQSIDPTSGVKTWYYIEARRAVGFDAFLTDGSCLTCYTQNETNGVLFHLGTDGNGNTGDLLDMTTATPTASGWFDPSLAAGQTFQDPHAGLSVTTAWVTSTQAAVDVQFAGALAVATNQAIYSPGQTLSATAIATYGGTPVANVSVSFSLTKANGNVVTGSATTGKNGAAVFKLRLKSTDPAGTYLLNAAATIKGNLHSTTTNFTVQ